MRDSEEEEEGRSDKGVNWRFGGSSRRKLTQVRNVTPAKIGSRAMQRKHSLRLVTSRDSRIKFGIGATRLYFQTGWSKAGASESTRRIFLRPASKRHVPDDARVCATSDSTRSKGYGFRTRAAHSCKRVHIKCVKTRLTLIASAKKTRIHCQSKGEKTIVEESKRFQMTNHFYTFLIFRVMCNL